jgi:hypothetical protein
MRRKWKQRTMIRKARDPRIRRVSGSSISPSCLSDSLVVLVIGLLAYSVSPHATFAQKDGVAEKPYALLFVTVWGPDDHPVYGVKVRIRRADQKKPHWELYSDHRGELAQRLPPGPGDYVVSADPKGVKDMNGKALQPGGEVKVHFVKEERVDIGLHLKWQGNITGGTR